MSHAIPNRRKHPRVFTFSRVHALFDRVGSAVMLVDLSPEGFAVLASPETAHAIIADRGAMPVTLIADGLRVSSGAKLTNHRDHGHGAFRLGFRLGAIDTRESQALQAHLASLSGILEGAEAIEIH